MNNDDEKLVNYTRQLLDSSLDELDDSVLTKLKLARQQAIKVASKTTEIEPKTRQINYSFPNWLAPASSGAAFATLALTVTLFWAEPIPHQTNPSSLMEDLHILSANEELEFYQNLEFYLWLEDETSS